MASSIFYIGDPRHCSTRCPIRYNSSSLVGSYGGYKTADLVAPFQKGHYCGFELHMVLELAHKETNVASGEKETVTKYNRVFLCRFNHKLNDMQWGQEVFHSPPILQVLPQTKNTQVYNCDHRCTLAARDRIWWEKSRKSHCMTNLNIVNLLQSSIVSSGFWPGLHTL